MIKAVFTAMGVAGASFAPAVRAGAGPADGWPPVGVVTNRAPLRAPSYFPLPLGSIAPRGWLLTQMQFQRDGLTGHAEQLYADDLGTNSGWLGGTGESWERGPYYYKGLIPLAYELNDAGLKQTAQKWMEWLLTHQAADGRIGPAANNDWWPRMLATAALRDYYEATGDARVVPLLDRYFHYMLAELPARPLVDWGKARAGDAMEVVLWLYNQNGDPELLRLAGLLQQQAYDWTDIFKRNRFDFYGTDFQPKHNVNVAQALKMPAIYYQLSGQPEDRNALSLGWDNLMREHGLACGINSGTEFLSGNASVQGVELCATVEAMLSLETSLRLTGDPVLGDRLETIAFNALPAGLANHIKGLQYYTLPNNVIASNGGHGFNQDYASGSVPGPDSGFPCCRYNLHMGWPKYVQNAWAATADGGLALLAYGPMDVSTRLGGQPVRIAEETSYPFDETVRLHIAMAGSAAFPLVLRMPGWCAHAAIDINGQPQASGAAGTFRRLARTWQGGDEVTLHFPMSVQTQTGPSRAVAIRRGPLVYSLKIGEQWTVRTPDPLGLGFDEFEVHATTPWAYALALDPAQADAAFKFTQVPTPADPFDPAQPSVRLTAQARWLPDWTMGWRGTHAFEPPCSPVASTNELVTVTLVPFGSQHLRISWFPYLGEPRPTAGLFTEHFDPTWSERWTVFGGNWVVRNHTLSTVPGSAGGARALAMATAFTNFIYEGEVSVGPVGNAGLVFRASKPDIGADDYCGYYAGLSAERGQLELGYANHAWHSLTNVPVPVVANRLYHLKVQAVGEHLRVFLGGQRAPLVDLVDAHFATGMVGVRDYCADGNQSLASFSEMTATELSVDFRTAKPSAPH